MAVQVVVAPENDEGAVALFHEDRDGLAEDVHDLVGVDGLAPLFHESPGGNPLEEEPEILLKDDHQGDKENGEEPLEEIHGEIELELPGQDVDEPHDGDADENEPGGGLPEPDEDGVYENGNNENVDEISDSEIGEKLEKMKSL